MKDIPFFTTDYGVAGLILKEVPYKKEAYIRILEAQQGFLPELLQECVGFCTMAGAERIYATGHEELQTYPLHTAILEMRGTAWVDREKLANLFPVTEPTVSRWRAFHNQRMADVSNGGTLDTRDENEILTKGGAYFVHDNGKLLGIGWMEDCHLLVVAANPGAGERVMHTMMSLVEGDQMVLEVASTNARAIRLYEKLGFLKTAEVSRWYCVKNGL